MLIPQTRTTQGRRVEMESFAISPEISPKQGGMLMVLSQEVLLPGLASGVRVNDAVAVAGLQAANGNRRRAVVLVLAAPWEDASRWDAPTVNRFLGSLNVPLYVWNLGEDDGIAAPLGPIRSHHELPGSRSGRKKTGEGSGPAENCLARRHPPAQLDSDLRHRRCRGRISERP